MHRTPRRLLLLHLLLVVLVSRFPLTAAEAETPGLYPEGKPLRSGHLAVSSRHRIYWEECGRADGIPVIVLHGAPGGSARPAMRRFFDPERFRAILFDQRGAGRSLPLADWRENTTRDLVEDIENWYMMHGCFLEDGELLKNTDRIAHIPTSIVHGRYDMICPPTTACALARRLKTVQLTLTQAGHSWSEPENSAGLVTGIEWVAARVGTSAGQKPRKRKTLRVAAAQLPVSTDIDRNVKTILRAVERAIAARADILLTPEGSLSGYTHTFDRPKVRAALAAVVERAKGSVKNNLGRSQE